MGSRFNVAHVRLEGEFVPDLEGDFQDVGFVSEDGGTCYLVQWRTVKNEPGFCVWRLTERDHTVAFSRRIGGCCERLDVDEDRVRAITFLEGSGSQAVPVTFE